MHFRSLFILIFLTNIASAGDLYLNIIWHQHQPLYLNPATDQLEGPWVRTHATKDYYDMAAMHSDFPDVHATINLTSSLLYQLQHYYVERFEPFLKKTTDLNLPGEGKKAVVAWEFDKDGFLAMWRGKTDPWIDLALTPSTEFTQDDIDHLVNNPWCAFSVNDNQIARFPEYKALRDKPREELNTDDYTAIKCWFYLANFDPDFLRGKSHLPVNLTDLVREEDGKFYLNHPLTEADAVRLVRDAVLVMREVVPVHKHLLYDPRTTRGQLDIITTPYYHPILPLLINSDIARVCQPRDSLPAKFSYPQDALAQVIKGIDYYTETFGSAPRGMWPAEGSISADAAAVFASQRVEWICGDMHVLNRSKPEGLDIAQPYRLSTPEGDIVIVFRETYLSDHIGFTYQKMQPDEAASHFLEQVLKYAPTEDAPDRLLTVILDGENAWEWYEYDMDAKQFLRKLYTYLSIARAQGKLTCVTPSEYIIGNRSRNIPPHPITEMTAITDLWPGSWINANYDTWIGEDEENKAWEYLRETREALAGTGFEQPDPHAPKPTDEKALAIWNAYESIYAAEGSDWFWWYGADQTVPGGDRPFEEAFFSHLNAVYRYANAAGANLTVPEFAPILSEAKVSLQESGGVMARSDELRTVRFVCDASGVEVPEAIYIAGNYPAISEWKPNTVRLYDDGTHGDQTAHDKLWSLELEFPVGAEIQYKYTNSGEPNVWQPSEEFPSSNRAFSVEPGSDVQTVMVIFGER